MATATLYKIDRTKGFMASEEGVGYSLYPFGHQTEHYEGSDDGGKEYTLPSGYTLGETTDDRLAIFDDNDDHCTITMHPSGRPQLVSLSKPMPVLFPHGNTGNKNALKPDSKRGLISVRVATEVRDKANIRAQSLDLTLPQYISKLVLED